MHVIAVIGLTLPLWAQTRSLRPIRHQEAHACARSIRGDKDLGTLVRERVIELAAEQDAQVSPVNAQRYCHRHCAWSGMRSLSHRIVLQLRQSVLLCP